MSEPNNPAIDEPVVFSHVEAYTQMPVVCPDCEPKDQFALLMPAKSGIDRIYCPTCKAEFLRPKVTLERAPTPD